MRFLEQIIEKAKKNRKTIVLPETGDRRILQAAHVILQEGIADLILLGDRDRISRQAEELDLGKAEFLSQDSFHRIREFGEQLYEMRKQKGMTQEQAHQLIRHPLYFGVMLVKTGIAHGMVAGAVHSTADTLRPALQILRTAPATRLVSGIFIMDHPDPSFGADGIFAFGDCGVVENPDAEELADIAITTATTFRSFTGQEPVVALLSYSTYGSASSPLTKKVADATRLAREKAPGMRIDGELQADAALVKAIGEKKAPGSPVAGQANVLIFPDLNSGNIAYKLVERLGRAKAYGPILQGIAMPVNDLSRGCSAEDIVGITAMTVVQAMEVGSSHS